MPSMERDGVSSARRLVGTEDRMLVAESVTQQHLLATDRGSKFPSTCSAQVSLRCVCDV